MFILIAAFWIVNVVFDGIGSSNDPTLIHETGTLISLFYRHIVNANLVNRSANPSYTQEIEQGRAFNRSLYIPVLRVATLRYYMCKMLHVQINIAPV